jgi:hypothetical protein
MSHMGPGLGLSHVHAMLLCDMGLQRKGADDLTAEPGLPINQTLAMLDTAAKKMSMVFGVP